MRTHAKKSAKFAIEIEQLITKHLSSTWAGDEDGAGINRVIEILRNNTTDNPCVVKAKEDEPIFVLRGQDKTAPCLVMAWAQLYDEHHMEKPQAMFQGTPRSGDAMDCAEQMARYHTRKFPD